MKRNITIFAVLFGLTASSSARAGDCSGVVQSVTLAPEGDVYVDFDFVYSRMRICQLDTSVTVNRGSSYGGNTTITAGRCAGLLSAFLTAKAGSKAVTARVEGSCAFTDGAYPNPFPFQFVF